MCSRRHVGLVDTLSEHEPNKLSVNFVLMKFMLRTASSVVAGVAGLGDKMWTISFSFSAILGLCGIVHCSQTNAKLRLTIVKEWCYKPRQERLRSPGSPGRLQAGSGPLVGAAHEDEEEK